MGFLPRALDPDLAGIMKAAQPFEWERIPFYLGGLGFSNKQELFFLKVVLQGLRPQNPKNRSMDVNVNCHPVQIRGESVDEFICQAQDRTRNAHSKSLAAAWNVCKELLQADQVAFESDRISTPVCKVLIVFVVAWIDHSQSVGCFFGGGI